MSSRVQLLQPDGATACCCMQDELVASCVQLLQPVAAAACCCMQDELVASRVQLLQPDAATAFCCMQDEQVASRVQLLMSNPFFRCYRTSDVIGEPKGRGGKSDAMGGAGCMWHFCDSVLVTLEVSKLLLRSAARCLCHHKALSTCLP